MSTLHQQHASSTVQKEEILGRCRCTYSGKFDAAAVVDVKGIDGTVQNTSPMCIHGHVKDGQVRSLHACRNLLVCAANPLTYSDRSALGLFGSLPHILLMFITSHSFHWCVILQLTLTTLQQLTCPLTKVQMRSSAETVARNSFPGDSSACMCFPCSVLIRQGHENGSHTDTLALCRNRLWQPADSRQWC